jgi:GNAT superfamily N-acetyltransferase
MRIVDLDEEHEGLFHLCLEDWSDEAREAGPTRAGWCQKMKENGLKAKLAVDDQGVVGGMIQYLPIEHSFVEGEGLYFIPCIWVHGRKEGRGNHQKRGMGKALLSAAEQDARSMGASGMAAWGISLPFWMRASWFKRQGYETIDKDGISVLVWKRFSPEAKPPSWIKQKKGPELVPGKVTVTCYVNGWCQAQNLVYERAKRAAGELGDAVVFREIDTSDKSVVREWGIADGVFVDDHQIGSGPPMSYEQVKKTIYKGTKKLR